MATTGSPRLLTVEELPSLFHDLKPVPQDDGPNPVCQIDYSPAFTAAYDYLRAVLRTNEQSPRALQLSHLCLTLNPANYTVWHFRRLCLRAISSTSLTTGSSTTSSATAVQHQTDPALIQSDLELAAALGGTNPKNYQLWYHRRALLEQVVDTDTLLADYLPAELDYIHSVLQQDGKNYHAYSHRQWIVKAVNDKDVWNRELDFCDALIQADPRNNSAWNQRWFAVHHAASRPTQTSLDLVTAVQEIDYAIAGARLDPCNESPWRYLIGLVREQVYNTTNNNNDTNTNTATAMDTLLTTCIDKTLSVRAVLQEAGRDPATCSNLSSALVDLLEFQASVPALEQAVVLADGLAEEYDLIRKTYWRMRSKQIQQALVVVVEAAAAVPE